ncbi:MAG: TIR domain-containing protein [Pseudomonadota bacterium]
MDGTRYAAFISYNSVDRPVARRLQHALESYSIPRPLRGQTTAFGVIGERIGKVCRDRTDFKSGESLNAALTEALNRSSALVVLCSPDSARSKWVNAEVEHFKASGRAARIFPVVVRTDETRVIVNSYPPALRHEDGDEAIAADLQPAGDGWHDGVLKVLASILDVDFDALRQRALEAARRRARAAYGVASTMAALAAVAVASSVIAVRQRNQSLKNFEDAIQIAAGAAKRTNELANETQVPRETIYEFLTGTEADLENISAMESLRRHPRAQIVGVEFQLSLAELFGEVGRRQDQLVSAFAADDALSDIKTTVENPLKRWFDGLLFGETNLEFASEGLEGDVAESMGRAWLNSGALTSAQAQFERCRKARAEFLATWELDPEEEAFAANGVLACAANEANVLAMLNRPGAAIANLEADIQAANESNAARGFARLVLAQLYADNGRLAEGIKVLDAEIARYGDTIHKRQPRIELAKLLETRAKALALGGRIAEASADLERADALLKAFLAEDGNDRRALLLRGDLLTTTGEIAAFGGERARAALTFRAAEDLLSRLVEFDGTFREWRLARARLYLARADNALRLYEDDAGKTAALAAAEKSARAALADIEAVTANKADVVAARLSVIAQVSLARTLRLRGDAKAAHALLDGAAARIATAEDSASALRNILSAAIADERGDLATAERNFEEARANFDRSIVLQKEFLKSEPSASLVARDLLWTSIASARSLRTAGDGAALKARLADACALKSASTLSEYSLFARDAETLETLAAANGVAC